ncbi:hypothetical protein [Marvinbryantia formatexigens]|uniref:hypothetical protein n=1 Tax=Marvinbryantia formatexigens TaxID=168384 RepID=UPI001A9A544E|nr:hypothetical protein [Marvinbryantia formatexigens]
MKTAAGLSASLSETEGQFVHKKGGQSAFFVRNSALFLCNIEKVLQKVDKTEGECYSKNIYLIFL